MHGTINDVAMAGANPLHLAASYIIEEAFRSPICSALRPAWGALRTTPGVTIVTGDTKVVERGKGDGVFIATTGIGIVPPGLDLSASHARPGDRVIPIGFDR